MKKCIVHWCIIILSNLLSLTPLWASDHDSDDISQCAHSSSSCASNPNPETDRYFVRDIKSILGHETIRKLIAFIYPFFVTDEEFFLLLNKKLCDKTIYPWLATDVLNGIVKANFPNGMPSPQAISSLESLLDTINASKMLRDKIEAAFLAMRNQASSAEKKSNHRTFSPLPLDNSWENLPSRQIAIHLTHYHLYLLKNISLTSMRRWLLNLKTPEISAIYEADHKIINLFSHMIVREQSHRSRLDSISKISAIIKHLLTFNNFWGFNEIMEAINLEEIKSFINSNSQDIEDDYEYLQKASYTRRLNAYNYVENFQRLSENKIYLNLVSTALIDLEMAYNKRAIEIQNLNSSNTTLNNILIKIGTVAKVICDAKADSQAMMSFNFDFVIFKDALFISDDVINELAKNVLHNLSVQKGNH